MVVRPDALKSPRDAASGLATGKRQHTAILIGMRQAVLMGDGSVKIIGEDGTQATLGNGLHQTGDGKLIIIVNSKMVGPDRIVDPQAIGALLPAVKPAAQQSPATQKVR
jgi:hypothetical protein